MDGLLDDMSLDLNSLNGSFLESLSSDPPSNDVVKAESKSDTSSADFWAFDDDMPSFTEAMAEAAPKMPTPQGSAENGPAPKGSPLNAFASKPATPMGATPIAATPKAIDDASKGTPLPPPPNLLEGNGSQPIPMPENLPNTNSHEDSTSMQDQQQIRMQHGYANQIPMYGQMSRQTTPKRGITWQSEADLPQRRKIIAKIVGLLQQRKPDAPQEWVKKLPDMARRLEDSLYRDANSIENYSDITTLKERLQKLAVNMGVKAASTRMPMQRGAMNSAQQMHPRMVQQQTGMMYTPNATSFQQDFNTAGITNPGSYMNMAQPSASTPQYPGPPGKYAAKQNPSPAVDQRQHVLRQQQQRLLLLRHASKCPAPEGHCQATPHCAGMKGLWAHIAKCKDQQCQVSHCVSSRYVLSHYHRCKDAKCAVCGPVRDAIQRHTEKPAQPSMPFERGPVGNPYQGTPNVNNAPLSAMDRQSILLQSPAARSMQAKMAGLSQAQVVQHAQATRGMVQQAMAETQRIEQQAQAAFHMANNCSPRSKSRVLQDATTQRNMVIQAKQKTQQLQAHYQVLVQIANSKSQQAAANFQQAPHPPRGQQNEFPRQEPLRRPSYQSPAPPTSSSDQPLGMPPELMQPVVKQEPTTVAPETKEEARKQASVQQQTQRVAQANDVALQDELKRKIRQDGELGENSLDQVKQEAKQVSPLVEEKKIVKYVKEGSSMLSHFSDDQVQRHLDSLQKGYCSSTTAAQLKTLMLPVLKDLMDHEFGWVFNSPVDPVALGIPDYFTIVKHPMDLGTVKKRLEAGFYRLPEVFANQVRQTFENAILYNENNSDVYKLARDMLSQFDSEFKEIKAKIEVEEKRRREKDGACRLCGGEKFMFEPLVFYCNGPCNARIRRNTYYFTCPENKFHWCQPCYTDAKDKELIAGEKSVKKEELTKRKNDELHEEPWVQCDKCNRWVHQICVLFNGRKVDGKNEKQSEPFYCPSCLLEVRKSDPAKVPIKPNTLGASELSSTKLSCFLETRVAAVLQKRRKEDAETMDRPIEEVQTAENLVIRQVSNVERQIMVRDKMYERYKEDAYPNEFRYTSKCLCMFQEVDGVSTLLFGMYIHEFDDREPEPNRRRVYVSYLDSVHYFRPAHLRTLVYHEMLSSYLEFAKRLGYHTAHIWACPPLKGDDYILYCHPEEQKTPKSDRLRQWYVAMLLEAQQKGIVTEITNIYAEYWRKGNNASVLPYFEGDYWVGVAEEFIKDIEEDEKKGKKKAVKKKQPNNKKGSKKKNNRKCLKKSNSTAWYDEDEGADELMIKLGGILEPMKDDFLIVKLQHYCQVCRKMILSGERWTDPKTSTPCEVNPETVEYNLCSKCYEDQQNLPAKEQHPNKLKAVAIDLPEKCINPDEPMECDFFDTRQAFLSLCQENHYQFDEIRRAKHTSLMVLYHLHNPVASAYLYNCNNCQKDMASGNRWHCNQCNDFDICEGCKRTSVHEHELHAIEIKGAKEDTAEARKARQKRARSIQLHMQLLVHASGCKDPACPSGNCPKMKTLLNHGSTCTTRSDGGCRICRRIWALLQIHARQCRDTNCPVPRCTALKQHFRGLYQQQQQMDNRRRAAVTEHYRQQSNVKVEAIPNADATKTASVPVVRQGKKTTNAQKMKVKKEPSAL